MHLPRQACRPSHKVLVFEEPMVAWVLQRGERSLKAMPQVVVLRLQLPAGQLLMVSPPAQKRIRLQAQLARSVAAFSLLLREHLTCLAHDSMVPPVCLKHSVPHLSMIVLRWVRNAPVS